MQAGRELDALIAEKCLGWTAVRYVHGRFADGRAWNAAYGNPPGEKAEGSIPAYSTDIAAAWPLVEKCWLTIIKDDDGYMVGDLSGEGYSNAEGYVAGQLSSFARAATATHAICLAALRSVGVEVSEEKDG